MCSRSLSIVRPLVCLLGLPWLALFGVFLICYSPFYLLFSLVAMLINENQESKREINNNTSKTGLTKLEVKHA